jgi:hypothetical protein
MRQARDAVWAARSKWAAAVALATLASTAQAHAGHGVVQGLAHMLEGEHGLTLFVGVWAFVAAIGLLRRKQ